MCDVEDDDEVQSIPDILLKAPDQESPDNILNKLPVECLRTIFEASTLNLMDLVEIANVCWLFNATAKEVFKSYYAKLQLTKMPLWRLEYLLRTFGPLITSILNNLYDIECVMVAKYCPNIRKIYCTLLEQRTFNAMRALFTQLDVLRLHTGFLFDESHSDVLFGGDMHLEDLCLILSYKEQLTLPNQNIPHLIQLELCYMRLNMAEPFFQANPQLRVGKFVGTKVGMDFNLFLDFLPNITELHIAGDVTGLPSHSNYDCNVQHAQLRTLKLKNCNRNATMVILQAMVQHEVALDNLEIFVNGCDSNQAQDDFINAICQIPTIKCMSLRNFYFNNGHMIRLARESPNLNKLHIQSLPCQVPLNGIRKFMDKAGEQLADVVVDYVCEDRTKPFNGAKLEHMSRVARARGINLHMSLTAKNADKNIKVSIHDLRIDLKNYHPTKYSIKFDLVLEEPKRNT